MSGNVRRHRLTALPDDGDVVLRVDSAETGEKLEWADDPDGGGGDGACGPAIVTGEEDGAEAKGAAR